MEYLLLIHGEEKRWAKMSNDERSKIHQAYLDFTQSIVRSGHFRAGAQLQPTSTATTVREKQGKPVTTDGPFVETKEQLGGYYLVDCRDLDEAISIAARIPSIRVGGSIEVRPVVPMPEEMRAAAAR
jgi:hypothetical protein